MKQIRCSVKYFCFGALLIFVGSILLCTLGFTVVLPYEATRKWPQVLCNTTMSGYNADYCSCTEHTFEYENCIDSYPCLQIYVEYELDSPQHTMKKMLGKPFNKYNTTFNGNNPHQLSTNEVTKVASFVNHDVDNMHQAMLYRSWSDTFYNSCSLHECGVEEWNVKESHSFKHSWGKTGQTYNCYYNPWNPHVTIRQRVSYEEVFHAVLWSSLCLTSGAIIWLGLWCGCWTIEMENEYRYPQRSYGLGLVS